MRCLETAGGGHFSHRREDGLGGVVAGVARLAAVGAHVYDDCRDLVCQGKTERRAREISRGLGFSGSGGEGERAYLRRTWLEIRGGPGLPSGSGGEARWEPETLARRRWGGAAPPAGLHGRVRTRHAREQGGAGCDGDFDNRRWRGGFGDWWRRGGFSDRRRRRPGTGGG